MSMEREAKGTRREEKEKEKREGMQTRFNSSWRRAFDLFPFEKKMTLGRRREGCNEGRSCAKEVK